MYTANKPISLHIELTDKCNALCVQCSRNTQLADGTVTARPDLLLTELTLNDFKFMFKDIEDVINVTPAIRGITFCGNFGDPIAARELLPICEYLLKEIGVRFIHIHTNGSLKTTAWWARLGDLFKDYNSSNRSGCVVTFAIDGDKDTHHLYRTNTNYNKIMSNATAYIEAGGAAEWSMIEFGHNKHQIADAKSIAKEKGFISFNHSKTQRFRGKSHIDYKHKGKEYRITAPEIDERIKTGKNAYEDKELGTPIISCKVLKRNELYISANGKVDACCWMGSSAYYVDNMGAKYPPNDIYNFFHPIKEDLNIKEIPLKDIIFDQFFTNILPKSWDNTPCNTCARTCGNEYRTYRDRQQL